VRQPDATLSYDLAILNGMVYDGTGAEAIEASVLIASDTIAFIGKVDPSALKIRQTIDATNKIVCPGFIDPHAHGDPLDGATTFQNFLSMGVTTIALGQDGSSPINSSEKSLQNYFTQLEGLQSRINIAMMAGHGSLRAQAGVPEGRAANASERQRMADILDINITSGCFGLTSGLEYVPGLYADSMEMVNLATIVGENDAVMMSHMRSEDDQEVLSSITELGWCNPFCRTHISHLKVVYAEGVDRANQIFEHIKKQSAKGQAMTAEVYPYNASYTGIGIVFPSWAKTPSDFASAKKDRNAELRDFLRNKVMQRNGPGATLFGTGPFAGSTLEEVATKSGKDFVDILMEMGPFGASGAFFVMNEGVQDIFITHPEVAICSDGSPTMRHPRGHGSFARIIEKYVVAENQLPLAQAIYKMSGLPASILRLSGRGLLKEGYFADVLVFDPNQVRENATWKDPFQLATGIEHLIVNGTRQRSSDRLESDYSGRILYSE